MIPAHSTAPQSERSLASEAENEPAAFHCDDFVVLTDNIQAWLVRVADISVFEACENYTRVHFAEGQLLIRRSLRDCESRLDSSTFFRTARDCIVNLGYVKQIRHLGERLIFVLRNGKEFVATRRQSVLFRTTRRFNGRESFERGLSIPHDASSHP